MVETPSPAPDATDAVLSQAAAAAAEASTPPRLRIVRADLPSLIATLLDYSAPANQHLDRAIQAMRDAGKSHQDAVRETPHFETLRDWCAAHPDDAARIVLCAVYLASGRYVAQEEVPQAEPVAAQPQPQSMEAESAAT